MSSSIFIYRIVNENNNMAAMVYDKLMSFPEDNYNYFNLNMLSENELVGKYVVVRTVKEERYNSDNRIFETINTTKADVVDFTVVNNMLEVWGNKKKANQLLFTLAKAFENNITIDLQEISINRIVDNLSNYKVKIANVSFDNFTLAGDIVGKFSVNLSNYSDALVVLKKYREKISRMTIVINSDDQGLKISITSKGVVTVYKPRENFEDNVLDLLHAILLK